MTHGTRVDGSTEMKVSGFNWGFLGPAFTNSGGKTQGFQPFPHLSGSAPSKDGKESPLVSMSWHVDRGQKGTYRVIVDRKQQCVCVF